MILAGLEPAILDRGRECFVLLRAIFQRSSLEVLSHAYPREKNPCKEFTLQGEWFRISSFHAAWGRGKSVESRLLMTQWPNGYGVALEVLTDLTSSAIWRLESSMDRLLYRQMELQDKGNHSPAEVKSNETRSSGAAMTIDFIVRMCD